MRFTDRKRLYLYYRWEFLNQLEQIAPEVKWDLQALAPLYREILLGWGESDEKASKFRDEFAQRFADLIEKYSLNTRSGWLRDGLLHYLAVYVCHPDTFASLVIACGDDQGSRAMGKQIQFTLDGWQVSESLEEFEVRARASIETMMSEHISETVRFFRSNGYKRLTRKYEFSNAKWLVHWTVKRMTKNDILTLISKERPTRMTEEMLAAAFRDLASNYDLPYRKRKRGKSQAKNCLR